MAEASTPQTLADRIEAIESAYEFMLGYAAQGLDGNPNDPACAQARDFLQRVDTALDNFGEVLRQTAESQLVEPDQYFPFLDITAADASKAQAAVRLVLAGTAISSQLVDNLNATIHLRTLLTDLFLIDEAMKASA